MNRNTFLKLGLKVFLRLFALDIICFITCAFCFSVNGSQIVRTLLQVACLIVMVAFVYPVCHTAGDLDAPLVTAGHKKKNNFKGLHAGLVACSPMIVSSVVLLVSKGFLVIENFVSYYKMINATFFPFLYSIMPVDYSIRELPMSTIWFAISIQIVIPLVCMFAYILGLNRFLFKEKIFYNKKAS